MTDDSKLRLKVFMSVLHNSRSIRYSYWSYQNAPHALKALMIVVYGLKCYLSLARPLGSDQQLLFLASYPNEHRVLAHVRNKLQHVTHGDITISLRNCFRLAAIAEFFTFLPGSFRLYRFARRLARRHHFMPACRILSAVTYYKRSARLLDDDVKGVFIACQYSPECLGLAAAAHQAGKKVLFTNHAIASGETGYVAPLHADLTAVTSPAMADIYQRHSPQNLNIVPFTIAEPQRPMQVPDPSADALVVGVYLTALTDVNRLQQIVSDFSRMSSVGMIFVRTHPAQITDADLSGVGGAGVPIEMSNPLPLVDDVARTDIAVCGNSSVAIEILRGGTPVLYDHRLDGIRYDYNGYVGRGLVLPYPKMLDAAVLELMQEHYSNEGWRKIMRYFDSGYQQDEHAIEQSFATAVVRVMQQA